MGWRRLRRIWTIRNLPTATVRSVAMGLAELRGLARGPAEPILSPVRNLSSVWHRVRVVRETVERGERRSAVVLNRTTTVPFYLEDRTGRLLVLPAGAEVEGVPTCDLRLAGGVDPSDDVRSFCDRTGIPWRYASAADSYRIQEWAVVADAPVYVLGEVARLDDPAGDRRAQVSKLLHEWLTSPARRAELDENRDGMLDPIEWSAARERAVEAVAREAGAPSAGPLLAVRKPRSGFFLVVSGDEADALKARGRPGAWILAGAGLLVAGLVLMPAGGWFRSATWSGPLAVAATVAVGLLWRRRRVA